MQQDFCRKMACGLGSICATILLIGCAAPGGQIPPDMQGVSAPASSIHSFTQDETLDFQEVVTPLTDSLTSGSNCLRIEGPFEIVAGTAYVNLTSTDGAGEFVFSARVDLNDSVSERATGSLIAKIPPQVVPKGSALDFATNFVSPGAHQSGPSSILKVELSMRGAAPKQGEVLRCAAG